MHSTLARSLVTFGRGLGAADPWHAAPGGDRPPRHPPARRRQALRRRSRPSTASTSRCRRAPASACSGPNGAGKSTTMRLLTAQAIADEGELEVLGFALPERVEAGARAQCGVVPQLDNLDTTLTVEQNLLVFTHLYRVGAPRARARRSSARWRSPTSPTGATRGRQALRRHAPAPADRPRAGAPAAPGAARRADRRARPAGAPGAVGADRRAARRGHHDPHVDALHRGGRAPRRHRHDHVPRPRRRRRPAGRADRASTPAARRSRSTARRRGSPRSRPRRRRPACAPAARARASPCSASTGADGRAPEGERRPANLEDVFVLLTGEEID